MNEKCCFKYNCLIGNTTGLPLYLESWKNLEFDNLGKSNLEKPGIFIKKPGINWNFQ